MAVKNNVKFAGIYDRIAVECVCWDCYTDEDAKRLAVYLPVAGVVNDPAVCVCCGEALDLTVLED